MAFRRFTRSRFGRSRSSFSRFRRPSMNTVRRPIRWSRGNFYLPVTHSHDDENRNLVTVIVLGTIQQLEATGDPVGASLTQAARRLEIGGLKFTCQRRLMGFNNPPESAELDATRDTNLFNVDTKILLVSDSMVTEPSSGGVSPQALNTNWFTNTLPTAGTPEIQDEDGQFPRRIHWQDYKRLDSSFAQMVPADLGETVDQIVAIPANQQVTNSHSTANLRLRLRLQDDECLAVHFASFIAVEATPSNEAEVEFLFTGTIWYRFVF